MKPLHLNTPLLPAPPELFGGRAAWLKMDALQPSGSFKLRGVGRLVQQRVAEGATSVLCASGGNAGMAAALVARACRVPVTIVVPQSTGVAVREAIAARGAQVLVQGAVWDEAHAYAVALAQQTGAVYVHPFDDPLLWDGHATLIDEVVAQGLPFDAVITSVGGGGLYAGIVEGLRRNGLQHVPVIAVETLGAESLFASVRAGRRITLPAITSIATSLGAKTVAQRAFDLACEHPTRCVTVSDAQAIEACERFANAMRVLVEPACGAALAALTVHAPLLARFNAPLIEICGGMAVDLPRLQAWTNPP